MLKMQCAQINRLTQFLIFCLSTPELGSRSSERALPAKPRSTATDGEAERVARITFTSSERKAEYLVDDLYVDPFARH